MKTTKGTGHQKDACPLFADREGQLSNQFALDLDRIYQIAKQIMESDNLQ